VEISSTRLGKRKGWQMKSNDDDLVEILRWLGQQCIELKTGFIALKGLLVEKQVLTPEEIEEFLQISRQAHLDAARQVGTSEFQALEELLRKFQKPSI
jgi:hypothetical protein